jgi:hypothetical protein
MQKPPWIILESALESVKTHKAFRRNETPIGVDIPFSQMSHVFLFNKNPHDTHHISSHIMGKKVKNNYSSI